jgi:hypothetical protein
MIAARFTIAPPRRIGASRVEVVREWSIGSKQIVVEIGGRTARKDSCGGCQQEESEFWAVAQEMAESADEPDQSGRAPIYMTFKLVEG